MIYYLKDTNNTTYFEIKEYEIIKNKRIALLKRISENYITYIIAHNLKKDGIYIEWNYSTCLEFIDKKKANDNELKTKYYEAKAMYFEKLKILSENN